MVPPDVLRASAFADRIRAILNSRGLTLAELSRASTLHIAGHRQHHVPHNFYEAIRERNFSPSLYQLASFARLSGYRLADWLSVFDLSLGAVGRLQASFQTLKTIALDSTIYHPNARIPWFVDIKPPVLSEQFVPLSQWISPAGPVRLDFLTAAGKSPFRYFRIGSQDNYAFPDLLPGSIVRVDTRLDMSNCVPFGKVPPDNLFLVEHSRGLVCSRLCRPKPTGVVLSATQLPFAPVELEIGTQASVLGIVDLEIRPITNVPQSQVPATLGRFWTPTSLPPLPHVQHAGEFIRRARLRCGLSFRETSERTRKFAAILGDARYFCAYGSLSDYETNQLAPRHIQKLISICAVYGVNSASMIEASGIAWNNPDESAIPAGLMEPSMATSPRPDTPAHSSFLREMQRRFVELPLFLHEALPMIFGLPQLSVRDVFWLGEEIPFRHPYLSGALFLVVDRRRKTPHTELAASVWDQPLHMVQRRDGTYFSGSCVLQEGNLVVRPWIAGLPNLLKLRNRIDVEIVGQVIGIVRRIR
jgi:transcriptional regulator with XRE-family HTH domain